MYTCQSLSSRIAAKEVIIMSKIQVTHTASVLFEVQPHPLSSIVEYVPKLDRVALQAPAFVQLLEKPVDQIPKDASIETGISVGQPVVVAAKNRKLTINAEVSGSLGCIRPDPHLAGTPLLESDPVDEGITFERKQCYMTLALTASVSAGLMGSSGEMNFGTGPR